MVDVLFDEPGQLTLEHRTPERTYALATIDVAAEPSRPAGARQFDVLRHNPEWAAERERLAAVPGRAAGQDALVRRRDGHGRARGPVVYACPMHPEVLSDQPGSCPKCG